MVMITCFTRGEMEGKWLSCESSCDCSPLTASISQVIAWEGKSCRSCQEKPLALQGVHRGYLLHLPDVTAVWRRQTPRHCKGRPEQAQPCAG